VRPALKIALIYICFSTLYIAISDEIVLSTQLHNTINAISHIQTIKGIIFVVASGALIFFIARNSFSKLEKAINNKNAFQAVNEDIISSISDGIGLIDSNGQLINSNRSLFELIPGSSSDAKGSYLDQIENDEVKRAVKDFLASEANSGEFFIEMISGRWIKLALLRISGASYNPYVLLRCEDISTLKTKEIQILENEKEFLSILHRIPFGIILFGKNGEIKCSNNISHQLIDTENSTMTGEEFLEVIRIEDRAAFKNMWSKALKTNGIMHHRSRLTQSGGEEKWYQFDALPISKEEREGHLLIVSDISTQILNEQKIRVDSEDLKRKVKLRTKEIEQKNRKLEESQQALTFLLEDVNEIRDELVQSNNLLASANKELEAYSYSVSHDLRAPLRTINGFSQALKEDYSHVLDETGVDYLTRIHNGTIRMGLLIDDMLTLSRISRKEMYFGMVNITSISKEIINELREGDPSREVDVEIQDNLEDYGDTNLLKIMFSNLLSNAWKFTSMKEDAKITVGSEKDEIFVRDNGVGFDMKYLDKVFEPFQRLHSAKEYSGTGIGLTIVRRIVQRHEGGIRVVSSVGEGTTFFLKLSRSEKER
jgi:PAS domain S-box-containing protein